MNGWNMRFIEDSSDFMRQTIRLVVWRDLDGRTEALDRMGVVHTIDPEVAMPDVDWFTLPRAGLEPLREELDRHLGRRLDEQLVNEVRSALENERQRVDRFIDRLLPDPPSPHPSKET